MLISQNFFQILQKRINIIDIIGKRIPLRHKGKDYIALCPFHQEKTPSFTVNPIKQFYYCFGCHAHGNGIKFISQFYNMNYKEAAILLAKEYGITIIYSNKIEEQEEIEINNLYKINQLASIFFSQNINTTVLEYFKNRNLNEKIIKEFEIGFTKGNGNLIKFLEQNGIPLMMMEKAGLIKKNDNGTSYEIFKNRIMFPIYNLYNKIIAFGGRTIEDNFPKYLNSPETLIFKKNEILYGEHKAIIAGYKKKRIIIVEGYIDLISLYISGFEETVATLGTAINVNHLIKLWKHINEIIICFDGDNAGIKATKQVIDFTLQHVNIHQIISFIILKNNQDPADIINLHGTKFFETLLDQRFTLSETIWYLETKDSQFTTAESKSNLEIRLSQYINKIKDLIFKKNYHNFFRNQCWKLFNIKNYNLKKEIQKTNFSPASTNTTANLIKFSTHNLEELILSFIIKYPEVLNDVNTYEQLTNYVFSTQELENFKQFLLSSTIDDTSTLNYNVEGKYIDTTFNSLYTNLTNNKLIQFYLPFLLKGVSPTKILSGWLLKQYYLLLLKTERNVLLTYIKNKLDLEKLNSYQYEIQKLEKELSNFNFQ